MVRYAEWREATDPERPLARYDGAFQLAASLALSTLGVFCCHLLSIAIFALAWRSLGNRLLLRRVERLRDVPARNPQIACRLTLSFQRRVYGRDEGLLSLVDGSLLFEGRRTSFSVPRSDARSLLKNEGIGFRFATPAGPCQAAIDALNREELRLVHQVWLEEAAGDAEGAIVFPPFRPDLHTRQKLRLLERILPIGVLFLGILAVVTIAFSPASGIVIAILTILFALVGQGTIRRSQAVLNRLQSAPALTEPDCEMGPTPTGGT